MAHVIVIGNEKGGSGKTTSAMHLIVSLLTLGFKVATIDLDTRQQSLTRYINNRKATATNKSRELLVPDHHVLAPSNNNLKDLANQEDEVAFSSLMDGLAVNDFIVLDTPGSDSYLSRLAHSYADTVVTPINDSFIDLDLIGVVSVDTLDSVKPGLYSAMLWEQKMKRLAAQKPELNWVVVRNRLSNLDAINKRNMESSLAKLAKRFGFKTAPGFGDRVVFKELFLLGLTLHDATNSPEVKLTPSVLAARQELREFIFALGIPEVNKLIQAESEAA